MPAPVVLFVYNRADHAKNTLEYLSKNSLASESELFIFSDGPKNEKSASQVRAVRDFLDEFEKSNPFKKITVIKSEKNKGLANSIISGVTKIINEFGRVIVVEDDVITSDDFLDYMNRGLEFYENNKKVFSLGGFSCPLSFPADYKYDVFAMERTSSYAWASWKDRWNLIDWQIKDYNRFKYNISKRKAFNACGDDRSSLLDSQMLGEIDSWAIRFEYNMVNNKMYSILPRYSRAMNTGHDGSGTHGTTTKFSTRIEKLDKQIEFSDVVPDPRIIKEYRKRFDIPLYKRAYKFFLFTMPKRKKKK